MEILSQSIKNLSPDIYEIVQKEVSFTREYLSSKAWEHLIQDNIFLILEEKARLLKAPIKDKELCGFICKYKGEWFVYINTFLPLEKQIFAAGHELYHLLQRDDTKKTELLKNDILEEKVLVSTEEKRANLFSALLLVPAETLEKELKFLKVKTSKELTLLKIVKLMNLFAVPYKTIILRLYEIDFITKNEAKEWLKIEDRDKTNGVLKTINDYQIGLKWQQPTNEINFTHQDINLKVLISDNQEDELLPQSRLEKDLDLIKALETKETN